jgi:hypothetical protein
MQLSWFIFVTSLLRAVSTDVVDSQKVKNMVVGAIKKQQQPARENDDAVDPKKIKNVVIDAIQQQQVVSEASVVFPQNLTFPAPKTYSGLGMDLGEPQHLDAAHSNEIYKLIEETREYVANEILADEKYESIHHLCKNQHASCAFWSVSIHTQSSLRELYGCSPIISLMKFLWTHPPFM